MLKSEEQIELSIDYFASVGDAICLLNLTNHAYFNLARHCSGQEALDRHIDCITVKQLLQTEGELITMRIIEGVEEVDGVDRQ
ncbi:unnamed protein product [Schistocephalus solidus]|uniref:Transcriptional regulator n=1 Tax=Schistocephalus solidus TaxID=70667 RepID=A0A183TAU2_SCHSO|nr:unnamed protein product [Schistocephalus solidus]